MTTTQKQLLGYEIRRVIGSGACGLVYLASESKSQNLYAIKEFPATTKAVQSFFHELSALFTLNHPNIIRCLNLIQGQGTNNYLVFEYAEGGTLRDRLIEGVGMDEMEALRIIRQVVLGLEQAHRHHIIHCDLKPENILVCLQDDVVTYKIGDLGVAVCLGRVDGSLRVVGSPAYMSPEQFYDSCSFQSDFYSIGVILYEMIIGERPFDGAPAALFTMHCREQADFNRIKHEQVRSLVTDLMSKQPFLRPASATDLLMRINDLLPENVTAPDSRTKFLIKKVQKKQLQGKWVVCETSSKLMPGSQFLFAPDPYRTDTIWISDDKGTDLYDVRNRRLSPQHLADSIVACSYGNEDSPLSYFATPDYIYSYNSQNNCTTRLFEPLVNIKTLQVDYSLKRIYYADSRRVYATTFTGHQLWRMPCENYYLEPCILALANGSVAVSSGPSQPLLRIIDSHGKLSSETPLQGPVIEVWLDKQLDIVFAMILGLGAEEPSRLLTVQNGKVINETEIGEGVYAVKYHTEFLSVHYTGRKTCLTTLEGETICDIDTKGNVLSDCWQPKELRYMQLVKDGHQTRLHIFKLKREFLLSIDSHNNKTSRTP